MFFAMARFRETKRNFPTTRFLVAGTYRLRLPCPQQAQQPQPIPLTDLYSPCLCLLVCNKEAGKFPPALTDEATNKCN